MADTPIITPAPKPCKNGKNSTMTGSKAVITTKPAVNIKAP